MSPLSLSLSDADDLNSIKGCAKEVESVVGAQGLNLVVNNAGILAKSGVQEATEKDMNSSFKTNVMGPLNVIQVREWVV